MRASIRLGLIVALISTLSGCTGIRAQAQLVSADRAVRRAIDKDAPNLAVYEFTMAQRYLDKAREEAGYSDYRESVELARKAAEWADQAIIAIEKEGRGLELGDGPSAPPPKNKRSDPPVAPPTAPVAPPTTPVNAPAEVIQVPQPSDDPPDDVIQVPVPDQDAP